MSSGLKKYMFTVREADAALRLDQVIAGRLPEVSREQARRVIQIGAAWVNGGRVQILSKKTGAGDVVTVYRGREGWRKFYDIAEDNIRYEDDWLLFYRKEPGIPTQGLFCDNYNNVYAALGRYLKRNTPRPYLGLHHRLDLDTSGVIVFTKSPKSNRSIHYQFKTRRVQKAYLALVGGCPAFEETAYTGFISKRDGRYRCTPDGPGKHSTTRFIKLVDYDGYCLLRAVPETGRTHQIRLHLAAMGCPVLGDPLYNPEKRADAPRTLLHAESLTLLHPIRKQELTVTAEPFPDMLALMK